MSADASAAAPASPASSSRGKNYTGDEVAQLSRSWLCISEDPRVGANQKAEDFWNRVTSHYNSNRPRAYEERLCLCCGGYAHY
jgi:hypothetical protein